MGDMELMFVISLYDYKVFQFFIEGVNISNLAFTKTSQFKKIWEE